MLSRLDRVNEIIKYFDHAHYIILLDMQSTQKKRCITIPSNTACTLCTSKNLPCDLKTIQQGVKSARTSRQTQPCLATRPSESPASDENFSQMFIPNVHSLRLPVCNELINLYFDMVHNKQQILFYRQSFLADWRDGLLPGYLMLGVIALIARFSNNAYFQGIVPHDRASLFLPRAVRDFYNRPDLISIHSLQGCVLLSFVCFVEGNSEQESLLSAQAVRMVQHLRLLESPRANTVEGEIVARLFWQALMMDTWNSARASLPRQLVSKVEFPTPLEEQLFEGLKPQQQLPADYFGPQMRRSSIWGKVIELNEMYAEVVALLNQLVHHAPLAFMFDNNVDRLTCQLDRWHQDLPKSLCNTNENLKIFTDQGRGRELAVLHLIYHHQGQLLYYPYLEKCSASSLTNVDRASLAYAARCKAHAEALSELMWITNTTPTTECLWSPVNGHLLVVASTVHLHTLVQDEDCVRLHRIRRLPEQNFVMLLRFEKYWPSLKTSTSRLRAFHQSCRSNSPQSSFQMDAWLFAFLNDYDSPVSERQATGVSVGASKGMLCDRNWMWVDSDFEGTSPQIALTAALSFS